MIDFGKISPVEWALGCSLFTMFLVSLWRLLRANRETPMRNDLENFDFRAMKSRRS